MQRIDTIRVRHQGSERSVQLYVGDLARLPAEEAVDVLVVSAFPNDYVTTASSLIGALHRAGVSVAQLARDREVDLRAFSSCWLSRPIAQPGVHFRRILCFEPATRGRAPEVVGDIFRSIVPFVGGTPPVSQIAMPLVASGHQGERPERMLEALVDAAVHWLSAGLALDRIKIVLHESADSASLRETFARVRQRTEAIAPAAPVEPATPKPPTDPHRYDVFVSYSHKDRDAADALVAALKGTRPSLRVFMDRLELQPGAAWQQHIFEALDSSRKVVCLFSPDYLASRICVEEFNIALMRHRETDSGVLLPLYVRSAELPGYMRALQYEDGREADSRRITECASRLTARL